MSKERQEKILQKQINDLTLGINDLKIMMENIIQ